MNRSASLVLAATLAISGATAASAASHMSRMSSKTTRASDTLSLSGDQQKSIWNDVSKFFEDVIEEPWQRDRPNYRRILATPTKVLLRGEEYYANLRNISPVSRLRELYQNTVVLLGRLKPELFSFRDQAQWKLTLGVLDQSRNAALQWAWFEHQASKVAPFSGETTPEL